MKTANYNDSTQFSGIFFMSDKNIFLHKFSFHFVCKNKTEPVVLFLLIPFKKSDIIYRVHCDKECHTWRCYMTFEKIKKEFLLF